MYLLWRDGIQLCMAEQWEPLAVLGTHTEEGGGGRQGVAPAERLHQRPVLL